MPGLFGAPKPHANALADLVQQKPTQPRGLFGTTGGRTLSALLELNPTAHGWAQAAPKPAPQPDYGKRLDGSPKGRGYLGEIRMPDGNVMTELSVGVDWGEGEQEIPSIVPGLTKAEIDYLRAGNDPTPAIIDRAINHAIKRRRAKLPVWATPGIDY